MKEEKSEIFLSINLANSTLLSLYGVKGRKQSDFCQNAVSYTHLDVYKRQPLDKEKKEKGEQEVNSMYKTMVVKYSPKAKEMAAKIEETANKMEQEGFEFVSCSIMPSSKGILVFRKPGEPEPEK